MSEMLTAIGTVQGITEKPSGWFEIEIAMPGKQYPLRVSTKKEEIIQAVRGVGANVATFTYNESDGNPNPHKPGTFYKNRYLEGVELGASAEAQQAAQQTSAAAATAGGTRDVPPEVWEAKERRDFRSRAWAHTISAFQHTIPTDADPAATFKRLRPFQQLVYHDIARNLADDDAKDDPDLPFE